MQDKKRETRIGGAYVDTFAFGSSTVIDPSVSEQEVVAPSPSQTPENPIPGSCGCMDVGMYR